MKLTSWLKILSRLRKPGIATDQKYKKMKLASLNFYDSASTALIDDYQYNTTGYYQLSNRNSDGNRWY